MKIKRLVRLGAATLLSLSSLLTLSIPLAGATPQTCVWTGGGSDTKMSTAANWSGASCNNSVPQAGDVISFNTSTGTSVVNITNDLGHSLGGVISTPVDASAGLNGFKIDTIALTAGAALSVTSTATCTYQPIPISYGTLTAAGDLSVDSDAHNLIGTNLTVSGNITLANSSGGAYLSAKSGSSVTGNVVVASPTSFYTGTCSQGQGGGIGLVTGASLNGFTIHGITVQKGASVDLVDATYPITLGGGSGTTSPEISFYGNVDNNSAYVATTYTVSGALTLNSDAKVYAGDLVTLNVTSAISGSGFALSADPTSTGDITFSPSSNNSNTKTGSQANAAQTVTASDSLKTTSVTVVPNETFILDGDRGQVILLKGSTLMGNGTTTYLLANAGSIVAPGHSPGCLTTDNLALSGTYQVQVGGTDACTGYDQLKVTSGATVVDVTGATLDVSLYNGFVPKVGQSYTIISNASSTAVNGTFTGIAEGGTYTNQGVTYKVTYVGGAGHDVVLTVTAIDASKLPSKPDTGLMLVTGHPMIAFGTSVAAAIVLIGAARKFGPASR